MNIEAINTFFSIKDALKQSGVIGVTLHSDEIQIDVEEIVTMPGLNVVNRDDLELIYPYRISASYQGINFIAVCDEEKIREFPILMELLNVPLEEDVDLSGNEEPLPFADEDFLVDEEVM